MIRAIQYDSQSCKKHLQRVFWALIIFCGWRPMSGVAQTPDPAIDEMIEIFLRDNELFNETDAQEFVESLQQLIEHPVDLNRATKEELLQTRFVSELQVENLLRYRSLLGDLLAYEELQAVPGFEADDVRRFRPFLTVNASLDNRRINLWKWAKAAKNDLFLRLTLPSATFVDEDWEGGNHGYLVRFRSVYENRMRYGFTAEKDPGEAFFKGSNRQGFDFYSAHFFLNNPAGKLKNLALGDFSARFGQGLLMQGGFSLGKSAESLSIIRGGRSLSPYGAAGEALFFRGAGATIAVAENLDVTLFGSLRQRDANLIVPEDTLGQDAEEVAFSSLQNTGLHRLPAEIEDEKAIKERAAGASLQYSSRRKTLGINALYIGYDKNLQGSDAPYRHFTFNGSRLTGISGHYTWAFRNLLFFGETARSDNGGMSTLNGLIITPDRKLGFALLHRAFGRDYQSVYAAPVAEVNGASNEQGLYFGFQFKPAKGWQFDAYADTWRNPWLRFGVDGPSSGQEYLMRLTWTKKRRMTANLTFFYEQKEANVRLAESTDMLAPATRSRLRAHVGYILSPGVELRTRVEKTFTSAEYRSDSKGYLAFQDVILKRPGKPFALNLRYAVFDTDDSNARIYTYENDISTSVSIPTFSGLGTRFFAAGSYRIRRGLSAEARWGQTWIRRPGSLTGSAGTFDDIRLLLRVRF